MKMPSKKIIGIIIMGLVVIGFVAYNRLKPQPLPQTINPQVQDLEQIIEVSGEVDAAEKADLQFPAMSRLTWVGVKEGDYVRKWQSIASVDTRTLQKQMQQNLNNFEKATRANDQVVDDLDVYDQSGLSDEEKRLYENSQFDLRNAALNVEIQDLAIRLSTLSTPIAGIVTHIDKPYAGEAVGPTDVFQVVNPQTLYFAVVADEIDVVLIKEGQTAQIAFDAYPNEPITTTVKKIEFAPTTGRDGNVGYVVHLSLPADAGVLRYRLGMSGTASVSVAQRPQVLTVPSDVLISRDGKTYVEVVENGEVVRKEVVIGLETEDAAEIVSGIDTQTAVVLPESAE